MPIISKNKIWFEGANFLREIKVNGAGVFSANLPARVIETIGLTEVTGKTKDEVERKFDKAIADYEAAQTTTKRVILGRAGRVSPCAPPKGKTTNVALIEDNGPIVPDKYYPSGRGLPLFEKLDFTKRTKLVRIKRRRQRRVARKTLTRLTKNKQTRK